MSRRSRAEWAELVREWGESGLSAATFGKRRRVKEKALRWWASKLERDEAARSVRPLELVEVAWAPAASDGRFEVHLANGRWVGVAASFDAAALARLLEVVEGRR